MRAMVLVMLLFTLAAPALGYQTVINPNPNLDVLWEQVHEQPEDFSVACVPLNDRPRTVLYNPNERFALASVTKLLIFVEYARRVDAGTLTMNEMVDVAELNRYDLNRTDRGAHDDFIDQYPAGTQAISLWEVASVGMMQYSSNAASDYLLMRLNPVNWTDLYTQLNITQSDSPHTLSMIALLMNNHETGQASRLDVDALSRARGELFYYSYLNDEDWRQAEITYRLSQWRTFPSWDVQASVLQQHTAKGTVYDFVSVMTAIYGEGGPLTAGTKQLVRSALRWEGYEAINNTYVEYGSKLGSYSGGALTLVAYGDPINGGPVVSVTFFRNISRDRFRDMNRADSIGDFAHWMNLNTCAGLQDTIQAQV